VAVVSKTTLTDAKAFLCWENFDDLAIQLVPLQQTAAFYFPPAADTHSIVLFYDKNLQDFSEPLFLLFHEAGHRQQHALNRELFDESIKIPNGPQRQDFEQQAWQVARRLFQQFVQNAQLDKSILTDFDQFAKKSINSYSDNSQG
jgi:hypothetical protein